jgi:uncharacterized protein (TIGR02996 family)
MSEEDAFIRAILAAPEDAALRLIYADWLEERADPRAEYLRLLEALDGLAEDDPRHAELREREQALQATIDLGWQSLMLRGRRRGSRGKLSEEERRRRREEMESRRGNVAPRHPRKTKRTPDPDDRHFSREIDSAFRRLGAEEMDDFLDGEGD